MLRGGPKISRKMIAFRKPDVDLSSVAMSIFALADLDTGCVAVSYASGAAVAITGTGSAGGGLSGTTSRGNRQSGSDSGGRVVRGGNGEKTDRFLIGSASLRGTTIGR
jgi:hypothetical protein